MKQIILGTAGHIDHGKTALIKAVTGINTDRLKEEKLRGITIELGFASIDLPSGQHIGIVDVPGHEKFVKNMVAGATGIDIVAMIIAADEGVMPQTREHMEICSLLGIKHGLVVLTKIDMVDEEWLELVTEDVSDFVKGTFLEGQPIVPVSSIKNIGIEALVKQIDMLCADIPNRSAGGFFRLPVDRVFTMKGFGTVITGTLVSGRVKVGETIMLYPSLVTSKVRGVQVHNQDVESAEAGMRTAINFQGLDKEIVNRGDMVAHPDTLKSSYMVDVRLTYLKSNAKPIKNRARVRFHTGTSEIMGILILLAADELLPGETGVAQLRLDEPVAVIKDDSFVIRSYSPVRTVGGGQVLNPIPNKHKRFKPDIIDGLNGLIDKKEIEIVDWYSAQAGFGGVSFGELLLMTNLTGKKLSPLLQDLLSKQILIQTDKETKTYVHRDRFNLLKETIKTQLDDYHKTNPLKAGMSREELKSKLPKAMGNKLFAILINQLVKSDTIVTEENAVRLAAHKVALAVDMAGVKEKIINAYGTGGLTPPYFKELQKSLEIDAASAKDVLTLLIEEGQIIKAKEDLYFNAAAIAALKDKLVAFLKKNGEIGAPQFKTMTNVSRKYLIPLLEYFDSTHVTIRIGDIRKLRGG